MAWTAPISSGQNGNIPSTRFASGQAGSGLAVVRVVIDDEDERFPKVVWQEALRGNKFKEEILWDGKFADGKQAGWGEYFITLKISDAAGNETMKTAIVNVKLFSFLQEIPAFAPPPSTTLPVPGAQTESAVSTFGGENNNTNGGETVTTNEGGENNNTSEGATITTNEGGASLRWTDDEIVKSGFSFEGISTAASSKTQSTNSNILWGAAATALVGATLADWQKKREEEARRLAELEAKKAANAGRPDIKAMRQAQKDHDAAVRARWAAQAQASSLSTTNAAMERKMTRLDEVEDARWTASQAVIAQREKEKFKANEKARLQAYYEGRKAGEVQQEKQTVAAKVLAMPVKDDDPPKWWEKVTKAVGQAWDVTKKAVTSAWDTTKTVVTNTWELKKKSSADAARQEALEDFREEEQSSYTVVLPKEVKPWWRDYMDYATTGIQSAVTTYQLRGVNVTPLRPGKVSVNASSLPEGTRAAYFAELSKGKDFVFRPGPYLTSTLESKAVQGFFKNARNAGSWVTAVFTSFGFNLYDFGKDHTSSWGDFSDATIEKQEFWTSTGVDTVINVAVGVTAVLVVTAFVATTTPLWLAALAIGATAIVISVIVNATGAPKLAKNIVNAFIDVIQNPPETVPAQPPIPAPSTPSVTSTSTPSPSSPPSSTELDSIMPAQAAPMQTPTSPAPIETPKP